MIRRLWTVAAGSLLAVSCAVQPGEASLKDSFAEQIVSVDGVATFEFTGDVLTFSGPDGRGGTANWRVRIDSATLQPEPFDDDDAVPYEGHILSSWYRDGELIEPLGSMSGLPDAFLASGVAQECYAIWDPRSGAWGW